jgi:hypothetical protein
MNAPQDDPPQLPPQNPCHCGQVGYKQLFGVWYCLEHFYKEVDAISKDGP